LTSPSEIESARVARRLAQLLDAAVRIPGTDIRIGLDAILGLIPGIGDLTGTALSGSIVLTAARLGASKAVLARMIFNLGIDTLIGAVPLAGDLFDLGWRANLRNVALLDAHLAQPVRTQAASRGVIIAIVLALLIIAGLGIALVFWVLKSLFAALGSIA